MTTTSTPKSRLVSKKEVIALLGWPTQCFAVDHRLGNGVEDLTVIPHTYVIFVPGNPGLIDWYVPFFEGMVRSLGPGYAARGVSNAGHSTDSELVNVSVWTTNKQTEYSPSDESSLNKENRDTCIPWTIDGQVHHKIAFIDKILERHEQECANRHEATQSCSFIFVSHSIGCHFTQKVAIMRPDILQRTQHFVHLMPYFRMKAPPHMQQFLDFGASVPNAIIAIHKALLSFLSVSPRFVADMAMRRSIRDTDARNIAVDLIQQPEFAVNFFSLGLEEIRDVPEVFDVRVIFFISLLLRYHISPCRCSCFRFVLCGCWDPTRQPQSYSLAKIIGLLERCLWTR